MMLSEPYMYSFFVHLIMVKTLHKITFFKNTYIIESKIIFKLFLDSEKKLGRYAQIRIFHQNNILQYFFSNHPVL